MLPDNVQSAIVVEHYGELMTTSQAVADGVQIQHKNVLALIRKYIEDLNSFGRVAFETRPMETSGGTQWIDVAWLNEQQATFLLTLMRNSPVVIEFKKALVHAFFALRDRAPPTVAAGGFITSNPAHQADQLVSADRIFRSIIRSSRSAGLPLPRAIRCAAEVAMRRTGIDLLSELGDVEIAAEEVAVLDPHGAHAFCDAWLAGAFPLPVVPCRSEDLYSAYVHSRRIAGEAVGTLQRVIAVVVRRSDLRHRRARYEGEFGLSCMSGFVLPEIELMPPAGVTQYEWLTLRGRQFVAALSDWRDK